MPVIAIRSFNSALWCPHSYIISAVAAALAWIGGGLFVASLLYTVYFYAVVLGDPAPANATSIAAAFVANLILFGLFAAHHSIFARDLAKRWVARVIPARMERSFYVWVASLLLIVVWLLWRQVPGLIYEAPGAARWLLYALQIAGVYLVIRAAGFLDALELAGIRQAQARTHDVIFRTDGPFGLVRHPIYLGWILMTFAAPTMTADRLLFAVITTSYLVVAIPWEERSLVSAFGERYRTYQSIVRWRLIPGVW
jgi:protein-S-isoprenylcysteine O-methyltransferase Ste14